MVCLMDKCIFAATATLMWDVIRTAPNHWADWLMRNFADINMCALDLRYDLGEPFYESI